MAICSNCYNGCSETTSDKCVKYTGIDVPVLGIQKGDSLSYIQQALITFLTSTINGSGIKITIDDGLYCETVSQYLQDCQEVTALDLLKALVQASCSLQTQVDIIDTTLSTLNTPYTVGCLAGITNTSDSHQILQAVIIKLCQVDGALGALALDVSSNYVKIANINTYIATYISSQTVTTRNSNKMIPYVALEYYGTLSGFSATGAGLAGTDWEDIYICNGLNGTPDKRGRVAVGAIAGVPGGALQLEVSPIFDPIFNPNYSLNVPYGLNSIALDNTQVPNHSHTAISTVSPSSHNHSIGGSNITNFGGNGTVPAVQLEQPEAAGNTSSVTISVTTSISPTVGGGFAHGNVQPVLPAYYIMFIPS